MIHTFELSKMISKAIFEEIQQQLSWDFYRKGIFLTMKYADYGFLLFVYIALRIKSIRNYNNKTIHKMKNICICTWLQLQSISV